MAMTIHADHPRRHTLAQSFTIDPALLQSRAAQEARRYGILQAKQDALRTADALLRWGKFLGWIIIFVSAIHIWESVASIAPADVEHLTLPAIVYHLAALGFTLMIDAAALFVSRANAVAALADAPRSRWTVYFYVVTALLNAAFVAGHAPALDAATRAQILPALGALFVIILPISVPAALVAVEHSRRTLEICRLALLADVATLRELGAATPRVPNGGSPQNAAPSVVRASAAPAALPDETRSGGRPTAFTVEDLLTAVADAQTEGALFTPREVRERLGCSEASAQRLLQAACAAGHIAKAARGAYHFTAPVHAPHHPIAAQPS